MFPALLFEQLRCIELLMTEIASNKEKGVKNSAQLIKEITSGEDLFECMVKLLAQTRTGSSS
jgi:hypothetical protein